MSRLLRLAHVDAGYGTNRVIRDVSLSVRNGELTALIGANGAGKTTLTKLMCRTMKPLAGSVELDGQDVWQMSARRYSRQVACVKQSERIAWPFTVEQIVFMGRFVHRGWISSHTSEDHSIVEHSMAMTGISGLRKRTFDTLSGGEAQRVVLARAIAQEPRLLILDEPVAHLDIKYQMEVLNTIRSFVMKGLAVVICLHDLTLTALYADSVALMHEGEIRIAGCPGKVLNEADLKEAYGTNVHVGKFPGIDKLRITPVPEWADQHNKEKTHA